MAMVDRRGLTRQALPAVAASRAAAKKQRRHRVVIESVAQEQKKLKTTISFQAKPPSGYTFIPAGNPDLTTALKEASRQANQQIYAVTTSPHHRVHDLSKEVHRIGFHFSSVIVAQVCAEYGITLDSKGVVADENAESFRQMRRKGQRDDKSDAKKDQITINTEAKGAIKDLFPKIPDNDLYTIIKGAFQKGQQKVGTANELPLVRRAQLSVVAHVRHVYTKYDKLLREVGYREARSQVENPTLKKLVEWRGDDDNTGAGKQVLEDVMREVIVLSDDEDSDDDDIDDAVEVVTGRASVWPRPSHHSMTNVQTLSPRQYDYQSAEDEAPGYRVITQAPRRRRVADQASQPGAASNQYRQSRIAAWDRAREEYRANPSAVPAALVPLAQHDPKFYYHEPEFNFNDPLTRILQAPIDTRIPAYAARQAVYDSRSTQPELVRGADGHIYERIYPQSQHGADHQRRQEVPHSYLSSQPPSPRYAPFSENQDFRDQAVSSKILPSIEDHHTQPLENGRSRVFRDDYRTEQPYIHHESRPQPIARRNVEIIDLTDGADALLAKRRKAEEPSTTRRLVSSFEEQRRIPDQARMLGGTVRRGNEPSRRAAEIVDLSSSRYVRQPPSTSPRMEVIQRADDRLRIGEGPHFLSDPHIVSTNAPRTRYAYETEPISNQHHTAAYVSPTRGSRGSQMSYGAQVQPYRPLGAEYRPEDPTIRSEDFLARRAPNHRDALVSAVPVPPHSSERVTYSREYLPVSGNEPQRPQLFYVDSPGSQHDRYERMPRPTYVRN